MVLLSWQSFCYAQQKELIEDDSGFPGLKRFAKGFADRYCLTKAMQWLQGATIDGTLHSRKT